MALTTFALTRVTDTDDDGSGTTGTIHNNAWKQQIYDAAEEYVGSGMRGVLTGRLYPVAGTPSWAGVTNTYTTIRFGPAGTPDGVAFAPGLISLYNGTRWVLYTFTEISLSLAGLSSGTTYDLFVYNNGGTLTLEAVAWVDADTPSSTTTQDGIEVKTGSLTKRFVGCININGGAGTISIDPATNPIWNAYNQLAHPLKAVEGSANWTYGSTTIRPWNNNTANRVTTLVGRGLYVGATIGAPIEVAATTLIDSAGTASDQHACGIGLNSTSAFHADCFTIDCIMIDGVGSLQNFTTTLALNPPLGFNYFQQLEVAVVGTVGFGSGGRNGIGTVIKC